MKALHVLAPASYGGLERVVHALAVGQRDRGYEVRVLALLDARDSEPATIAELRQAGIDVRPVALHGRAYVKRRAVIRGVPEGLSPAKNPGKKATVPEPSVAETKSRQEPPMRPESRPNEGSRSHDAIRAEVHAGAKEAGSELKLSDGDYGIAAPGDGQSGSVVVRPAMDYTAAHPRGDLAVRVLSKGMAGHQTGESTLSEIRGDWGKRTIIERCETRNVQCAYLLVFDLSPW